MGREDRMDREAEHEFNYNQLEKCFIYENMRPKIIGIWEWRLMFDKVPQHNKISEAMKDAKSMALELKSPTSIEKHLSGYRALPKNYNEETPAWTNRYFLNSAHYLKLLVIYNYYPDIVRVAVEKKVHIHYYDDTDGIHRRWKKEYEQLSESERQNFDRGPFLNHIPPNFWSAPEFIPNESY